MVMIRISVKWALMVTNMTRVVSPTAIACALIAVVHIGAAPDPMLFTALSGGATVVFTSGDKTTVIVTEPTGAVQRQSFTWRVLVDESGANRRRR